MCMMKWEKIGATRRVGKRCLHCLPVELLTLILGHMSILDYISCRSVCRCWRFAFSQCSSISFQDQTRERTPWVVFLRVDHGLQSQLDLYFNPCYQAQMLCRGKIPLCTTGKIGNSFNRRVFDVPELHEKLFLLSKYGWLLLFSSLLENSVDSSVLFFLNPFSRARIDLPFLDVSSLNHPTFAISSAPTSLECVIFVISCADNEMATDEIKISTCLRGEDTWTTRIYRHEYLKIPFVVNVVFAKGVFYCLHQSGHLSAFNVITNSWIYLVGPKDMGADGLTFSEFNEISTIISHEERISSDIFLRVICEMPYRLLYIKLKDPLEFTHDSSFNEWFNLSKYSMLVDPERAFLSLGNEVSFESFNLDSWYGLCELVDDGLKFKWRRLKMWPSAVNRLQELTTVAWLETRWVQPSQSLNWTTNAGC